MARDRDLHTRRDHRRSSLDRAILQDRRVLYALKALSGVRHGEAARLRWRHYRTDTAPLGTIDLGKTKTGVPPCESRCTLPSPPSSTSGGPPLERTYCARHARRPRRPDAQT